MPEDFLSFFDEDPIESSTADVIVTTDSNEDPLLIKPEAKQDETLDLNFSDDDLNISSDTNKKEKVEVSSTSNDYFTDTIRTLIDDELELFPEEHRESVFKSLTEGLNTDPNAPSTKEDLKKIVANISNLKGKLDLYNETSSYSNDIQKAIEFEKSGGKAVDYFKTLVAKDDITSLDINNEVDQEKIVRTFYKDILDRDDIDEKIQDMKDLGLLEKEATKLKPKLDKKAHEIAEKIVQEQQAINQKKEQMKASVGNSILKEFKPGIKGVKITPEELNNIAANLLEEQEFNYGNGNIQVKKPIEYLLDYHLYSNKGDNQRAILAYMVLNPEYDKKVEKMFSLKDIDKFIEDHNVDSANKFKIGSTKSNKTSTEKFKFK